MSFLLRAACFCLCLPWLISCGGSPAESEQPSALAEIQARGRLVAVSFPHQANRFVHPLLDELRAADRALAEAREARFFGGIEVELLRGFADHLGVELEFEAVTTSYADVIEALLAGKGDLIASGMTRTDARAERVDFSAPYATSWVCVIVRPGSEIDQIDDLSGRNGVVMRGSSHHELLQNLGPADMKLKLNDFKLENLVDLKEGRAEFTLLDSVTAPGGAPFGDQELQVGFRLQSFGYRTAFPLGSDLRWAFDAYVDELRAAGGIEALFEKLPLE